jgi:hypothetical protein
MMMLMGSTYIRVVTHGPLSGDAEWSALVSVKCLLPRPIAATILGAVELSVSVIQAA